jgi:hypothetical protein
LLFAEIHGNRNGAKSRHQTTTKLLRAKQIAFSTAKSTRFVAETANCKSHSTMHLGIQLKDVKRSCSFILSSFFSESLNAQVVRRTQV